MKLPEKKIVAFIALVLGIIALISSWIPIINNVSFVIAIPALVLGIVALITNRKHKKTLSIVSVIIAILSMVIVLATQSMYGKAIDTATESVEKNIKEDQKKAEDNFKWTKADYDALVVGDSLTGEGGTPLTEVENKFGESDNKTESKSDGYEFLNIIYDNMGAEEYKSVDLSFTRVEGGEWLLTNKTANGLE
ncbi:DUF308 domain-containing protein [Streptococcus hyovaginalis]